MKPAITTNGNLKMIEGDDKIRAQRCLQNIQVILDHYDCELHPQCTISPLGNTFAYSILPIPRQKVKEH